MYAPALAGRLADRYHRRPVMPSGRALTAIGLLLPLPDRLPFVIAGRGRDDRAGFVVHAGPAAGCRFARTSAVCRPPRSARSPTTPVRACSASVGIPNGPATGAPPARRRERRRVSAGLA